MEIRLKFKEDVDTEVDIPDKNLLFVASHFFDDKIPNQEKVITDLVKYNKPVVDDEPARKGTPKFGGPKSPVLPTDHILHIYNVWNAGGYIVYHHDMFQIGTDRESVPLNGIPEPGFSEYHDLVFSFLREKDRYLKGREKSN